MKYKALVPLCCIAIAMHALYAQGQSYFDGKFTITQTTFSGNNFALYDLSREGHIIKTKFFAQNAYAQYLTWKTSKQILLVTSAAFMNSYEPDRIPVGLCVQDGIIINKVPNAIMDGLVILYNNIAQQGLAVIDLENKPVVYYDRGIKYVAYPRNSVVDRVNFLNMAQTNGLTVFQTHLVYSQDRINDTTNLHYGDARERRFLAICRKDNVIHHVIVDAPAMLPLNLSASNAKAVLDSAGFTVLYVLNLETGSLNVLHTYNGTTLQNLHPYNGYGRVEPTLENSPSLLVYYKD